MHMYVSVWLDLLVILNVCCLAIVLYVSGNLTTCFSNSTLTVYDEPDTFISNISPGKYTIISAYTNLDILFIW